MRAEAVPILEDAVRWAEQEAAKPAVESQWRQDEILSLQPDCGTYMCIGGYIALKSLRDGETVWADGTIVGRFGKHTLPLSRAADVLGVPYDQLMDYSDREHALFAGGNELEDIRRIAANLIAEAS